jgi:hypothetical protein
MTIYLISYIFSEAKVEHSIVLKAVERREYTNRKIGDSR